MPLWAVSLGGVQPKARCIVTHLPSGAWGEAAVLNGLMGGFASRIGGEESDPSFVDLFNCFFWHQAFRHESASLKHW